MYSSRTRVSVFYKSLFSILCISVVLVFVSHRYEPNIFKLITLQLGCHTTANGHYFSVYLVKSSPNRKFFKLNVCVCGGGGGGGGLSVMCASLGVQL